MSMTRKQFLGGLAGGTVVLIVQGCGGGGGGYSSSSTTPPAGTSCSATTISGNHGHALTVPQSDLDSTTDKVYSIMGSASHDHTITLSAAMLAQLKAGMSVTTTSTTTLSHNHDVTVSCA
ncbi:MAG TPA: hypothetical protein VJ743_05350, partial [Albitalea sp.]|nr:hypothetical protein [Albitalea sp.]